MKIGHGREQCAFLVVKFGHVAERQADSYQIEDGDNQQGEDTFVLFIKRRLLFFGRGTYGIRRDN